jgi:DNA-binding MarR family transcriptional regulator
MTNRKEKVSVASASSGNRPAKRSQPADDFSARAVPQLAKEFTAWLVASLALRLNRSASNFYSREWGIGTTEYRLVLALGQLGTSSAIRAAEAADIDKAAASRSLQILVRGGFIETVRHGRSMEIRLSNEGEALHGSLRTASKKRDKRLTDGLSEQEIQQLRALLQRLIGNLPHMNED